jgi:hypothetical protein
MPDFVSHQQFVARFPALVLDQRTLPKKREALATLLVSAMVNIEIGRAYTESDINAKLQAWVDAFGDSIGLDRVTLRRMLVDEGYLHRDTFGTTYILRGRTPLLGYDPSIRSLDLQGLVDSLERQRTMRKEAHAHSGNRANLPLQTPKA